MFWSLSKKISFVLLYHFRQPGLSTDAAWDLKVCLPFSGPSFCCLLSLELCQRYLPSHAGPAFILIPVDIIPTSAPHTQQSLPPTRSYWPDLPPLQQHLIIFPLTNENFQFPYILAQWIPLGACYVLYFVPHKFMHLNPNPWCIRIWPYLEKRSL